MTPCADFNFYMDPEAALVMLSDLQCPTSIITYEISRECGLPWVRSDGSVWVHRILTLLWAINVCMLIPVGVVSLIGLADSSIVCA